MQSVTEREHVLIVEDDPETRFGLVELLSDHWEVSEASDGFEALQVIGQRVPDVVLSDLVMPRLNGLELVRRLRSRPSSANVPVLVYTAHSPEDAVLKCFSVGADDFVPKPFSSIELLARVRRLLLSAHARRSLEKALRRAASGLTDAEARARQSAALEFQTSIGLPLTLVKLCLEDARSVTEPPAALRKLVDDALTLASCALEGVQEITQALGADVARVDAGALTEILTRAAARWSQESQVLISISSSGEPWPIGRMLLGILFRASWDLIISSATRPEVSRVAASLQWSPNQLRIQVISNSGADREPFTGGRDPLPVHSLFKLRERLALLGGSLTVEHSEKQGHIVTVRMPEGTTPLMNVPDLGRLTQRERQVLQLIAEGKSSVEIGMLLRISGRTVDTHRLKLMQKLRVHTIAGLTRFAIRNGLCALD